MSTFYNKVVQDLGSIVNAIDYYENQLLEARYECGIKGSLEKSSAALPGITEYRFNQLQEIEAILEHLNIALRKERSLVFRKYFETYNKCSTHKNNEHYKKKLYSCSVCKKECKAQIDLAEHMLDQHQIIYKYL